MVHGNTWGVTVDCSGLYWPRVVLQFMVMPGVLLWTVVVCTGDAGAIFVNVSVNIITLFF